MSSKDLPVFPDYDEDAHYTSDFLFSLLGKHFIASDGVTHIWVPDNEANRTFAEACIFPEYEYSTDARDLNLHGGIH